jgi:predicted porin
MLRPGNSVSDLDDLPQWRHCLGFFKKHRKWKMTPRTPSELNRLRRAVPVPRAACLLGSLFSLAGVAHAQSTAAPASSAAAPSSALSWHGITLYGIVDIGLQYDTHAAPFSDYFMAGSADIVQKNSRRAITGVTSNNLSQSRVGLQGTEPLNFGDWSGVFKLETFFNPASGQLSVAAKSLAQNNGRALADQSTNLDSSVAGQTFQQSFAGLSSPTYGTITFGRQNSVLADGIAKYDPNAASQAFSLIGLSGTAAGGGDTQDRRLDSSLKYGVKYENFRFGAQYKFSNTANRGNSAVEVSLGGDYAGFSADAYYVKVNSAIALGALSAAQVATLPTLTPGFSPSNSLTGSISDNTTVGLLAMYTFAPFKFYVGYENIKFQNPEAPLPIGFNVAAYTLAIANNNAYPHEKVLQVYWAGAKWSVDPKLDVTVAYYGYHQSNFATTTATAGCSSNASPTCSGELIDVSIDAVYKLSKRFDAFAGVMYSDVQDGLANGYIYSKNNINPTIGVRFTF